ncbi:hypothetical protein SLU01_14780 [Sporosarcina luteola]|uniref:Uncharacterized protein n=1 Tax=Sporosarcina luteola TaxID=582850 RepID=A0A511Z6V0_9BACL|nr:hypothetical protein SLU01_14780 [Sporosarcina luteola]
MKVLIPFGDQHFFMKKGGIGGKVLSIGGKHVRTGGKVPGTGGKHLRTGGNRRCVCKKSVRRGK